jgi:hypothetical protein
MALAIAVLRLYSAARKRQSSPEQQVESPHRR